MTRTRTLDCDEDDDYKSDCYSFDSDSVALSVIIDQDLGLVGDTLPPNLNPPPIPELKTKDIDGRKYKYGLEIYNSNIFPQLTTSNGNQISISTTNIN